MKILEKYWKYLIIIYGICMFIKPIFCFIILGSIMVYIGWDYYRVLKTIENYGIQATGKILKYNRGWKGYQTPMINFSIKDGKIIEAEPYLYSATDINKFRSFKNYIDKPIEIKYNPNNPTEFMIVDQKTINKVGICILTLIGFFFSLMGILDILGIIHI